MPRGSDAPPAEGMQRIHWRISTNIVGSECSGWFDIEKDAPEAEIEECAKDAAFDQIEWNWNREGRIDHARP